MCSACPSAHRTAKLQAASLALAALPRIAAAAPGQFPYIAALYARSASGRFLSICGGSLVRSDAVLTAGAAAADSGLAALFAHHLRKLVGMSADHEYTTSCAACVLEAPAHPIPPALPGGASSQASLRLRLRLRLRLQLTAS